MKNINVFRVLIYLMTFFVATGLSVLGRIESSIGIIIYFLWLTSTSVASIGAFFLKKNIIKYAFFISMFAAGLNLAIVIKNLIDIKNYSTFLISVLVILGFPVLLKVFVKVLPNNSSRDTRLNPKSMQ